MIRTLLMLGFWVVVVPVVALIFFPWVLITGDILPLYRAGIWGAWTGVRIAGVKVQTVGREQLDPKRTYVFMSNHVSNLDPPILLPLIPGRTSAMAKQELFSYPILGTALRMASLVPVDRRNRRGERSCRSGEAGNPHDGFRRGRPIVRRQTAALQERPVLSG